jgi:type II secretory pathway component PulM
MKVWFLGLKPRERAIVAVGAAAAVVIVLWGFLLSPLRTGATTLRTNVETKQRLLVDVARLEASQPSAAPGGRQGAEQTLFVIVNNTAATYGLGQPRTRANGPSGIDVTLQGVPFDALMTWLVALHDTYGVDVETASFSSAREPGLVNGQILLHRL